MRMENKTNQTKQNSHRARAQLNIMEQNRHPKCCKSRAWYCKQDAKSNVHLKQMYIYALHELQQLHLTSNATALCCQQLQVGA